MADGFALAQAFVRIRPSNAGFRAEATSQIKSALAGVSGEVPVTAGTDKAKLEIDGLRAYLSALTKRAWAVDVVADDKVFQAQILKILSQLRSVDKRVANPKVTLEGLTRATVQLLGIDTQLDKISSKVATAHVAIDDSNAEQKLALLIVQLAALQSRVTGITISATDSANLERLQTLRDTIAELANRSLVINLQDSNAIGAIAQLDAEARRATDDVDGLAKALDDAGRAGGRGGGGGRFGFLGGSVPLFGSTGGAILGITGAVGGFHLLFDAVVEFLAVIIPATIALAAFGAAAIGPVQDVIQQFQTLNTVGQAMNRNLLPLGGTLSSLQDKVRPQVLAALGDALQVAGGKAGFFQRLVLSTGTALDQLLSRATLASKSSGFSQFLGNAAPDVSKLGTLIGNLFGIFGNFLKSMPGYAQVLLNVLVSVTHAIEDLTGNSVVQGILKAGLAVHGFFIYAGLAATGALLLGSPLGRLATFFAGVTNKSDTATAALDSGATRMAKAKAGWTDLGNALPLVGQRFSGAAADAEKAGSAIEKDAAKTNIWSKALGILKNVPVWGWVAVGAGALVGLIYLLTHATSATAAWAVKLQQTIDSQHSFQGVISATNLAISTSQTQTAKAANSLTQAVNGQGQAFTVTSGKAAPYNQAVVTASQNLAAAQRATAGFNSQAAAQRAHITDLISKFGTINVAEGLWNQAQIKSSDLSTRNKTVWQQDVQTLQSLQNALKAVAYSAGDAGNNERVLNFQLSDQYTNTQKLNQAWDAFIGVVTGSQTSFDTYAQGLVALNQSGGRLRDTLGKLGVGFRYAKSPIDSLSKSGVALNQAFTTQVTNVNAMVDSWRAAGFTGKSFDTAVKAAIIPLLKYASGSREATAQLLALAQEAGYHGPQSFRMLAIWLGNVKNATALVKKEADLATIAESNLTNAMSGQGNTIAQKLIGNINNAILAYNGVYQAATAYGDAVAKDGKNSDAAKQARARLIDDLIASGRAAHDSAGEIAGMITKVLGIPTKRALQIVMTGLGSYAVKGYIRYPGGGAYLGNTGRGGNQLSPVALAAGWRVPGYGGGDRHPAMLEGGETVVPKHLTPLVAPLLAGKVPGFANGVVNMGNTSVLSGGYAQRMYQTFENQLIAATVRGLTAGVQAAQATLAGGSGSMNPAYGAEYSFAQRLFASHGWALSQFPYLLRLWNRESGWNPAARNPSSGAAGIPQDITGNFHGGWPGQIVWGENYIAGRYGNPAGAWAHEVSMGWYDKGGFLPPGLTLAWNGTGRPEPVGATATKVELQVAAAGGSAFEQFMVAAISKWVWVRGGGDVQAAFGRRN